MGEFFRGWRRKIGVVTLLMSVGLTGAWIRSLVVIDLFRFENRPIALVTIDSSPYGISSETICFNHLGAVSYNLGYFSSFHSKEMEFTEIPLIERQFQWCGFFFVQSRLDPHLGIRSTRWTIPYWSIVIPPVLLSAYLLLVKPRKSKQKKNIQSISTEGNSIVGAPLHGWRRTFGVVTLMIGCLLLGSLFVVKVAAWRHAVNYPYGWSHCCINDVANRLEAYAETHDGHYPTGKESPEASLSLLHYQSFQLDADVLRGKTVPEEVVQAILDQEGFLGPDTCGWNYVDGLTQNDDRRLAIVWDKTGLGHNGERNPKGGREVLYVGGTVHRIPDAEWPKFLNEQTVLRKNRDEFAMNGGPVLVGHIKRPDGELLNEFRVQYQLEESITSKSGETNNVKSGNDIPLKWMGTDFKADGEMTWVLVFPNLRWRSKRVTVKIENSRPSTSLIVFEMEETK